MKQAVPLLELNLDNSGLSMTGVRALCQLWTLFSPMRASSHHLLHLGDLVSDVNATTCNYGFPYVPAVGAELEARLSHMHDAALGMFF